MSVSNIRFLDKPKWFETKQQLAHSLAMGCTNLSFFGLFALALWYGGRKIARGEMTGGKVLTVLLSVIIAGERRSGDSQPTPETRPSRC